MLIDHLVYAAARPPRGGRRRGEERAGADEVVSPYGLTGRRMAVLAVQPSVLEVLDLLNLGSDIRLEEVAVRAGKHLDSLTIGEAARAMPGWPSSR